MSHNKTNKLSNKLSRKKREQKLEIPKESKIDLENKLKQKLGSVQLAAEWQQSTTNIAGLAECIGMM